MWKVKMVENQVNNNGNPDIIDILGGNTSGRSKWALKVWLESKALRAFGWLEKRRLEPKLFSRKDFDKNLEKIVLAKTLELASSGLPYEKINEQLKKIFEQLYQISERAWKEGAKMSSYNERESGTASTENTGGAVSLIEIPFDFPGMDNSPLRSLGKIYGDRPDLCEKEYALSNLIHSRTKLTPEPIFKTLLSTVVAYELLTQKDYASSERDLTEENKMETLDSLLEGIIKVNGVDLKQKNSLLTYPLRLVRKKVTGYDGTLSDNLKKRTYVSEGVEALKSYDKLLFRPFKFSKTDKEKTDKRANDLAKILLESESGEQAVETLEAGYSSLYSLNSDKANALKGYFEMLRSLDQKSTGVINNDLNSTNIFLNNEIDESNKIHRGVLFIDWGEARLGLPETDLFRALFTFGYIGPSKEQHEVEEKYAARLAKRTGNVPEIYAQCKFHGLMRLAQYNEYLTRIAKGEEKLEYVVKLKEAERIVLKECMDTIPKTGEYAEKLKGLEKRIKDYLSNGER